MNEHDTALRALDVMGYGVAKNKRATLEILKSLDSGSVMQMRDAYKYETEFLLSQMNKLLDSVIVSVCWLCDREKEAWDDLPKDWGWYDAGIGWVLLCDECQFRYTEKFGKEPKIVRDLDDKY